MGGRLGNIGRHIEALVLAKEEDTDNAASRPIAMSSSKTSQLPSLPPPLPPGMVPDSSNSTCDDSSTQQSWIQPALVKAPLTVSVERPLIDTAFGSRSTEPWVV